MKKRGGGGTVLYKGRITNNVAKGVPHGADKRKRRRRAAKVGGHHRGVAEARDSVADLDDWQPAAPAAAGGESKPKVKMIKREWVNADAVMEHQKPLPHLRGFHAARHLFAKGKERQRLLQERRERKKQREAVNAFLSGSQQGHGHGSAPGMGHSRSESGITVTRDVTAPASQALKLRMRVSPVMMEHEGQNKKAAQHNGKPGGMRQSSSTPAFVGTVGEVRARARQQLREQEQEELGTSMSKSAWQRTKLKIPEVLQRDEFLKETTEGSPVFVYPAQPFVDRKDDDEPTAAGSDSDDDGLALRGHITAAVAARRMLKKQRLNERRMERVLGSTSTHNGFLSDMIDHSRPAMPHAKFTPHGWNHTKLMFQATAGNVGAEVVTGSVAPLFFNRPDHAVGLGGDRGSVAFGSGSGGRSVTSSGMSYFTAATGTSSGSYFAKVDAPDGYLATGNWYMRPHLKARARNRLARQALQREAAAERASTNQSLAPAFGGGGSRGLIDSSLPNEYSAGHRPHRSSLSPRLLRAGDSASVAGPTPRDHQRSISLLPLRSKAKPSPLGRVAGSDEW